MQRIFAQNIQQRALRPNTGADARALEKERSFAIQMVSSEEVRA
jgi:hypothetical protein